MIIFEVWKTFTLLFESPGVHGCSIPKAKKSLENDILQI